MAKYITYLLIYLLRMPEVTPCDNKQEVKGFKFCLESFHCRNFQGNLNPTPLRWDGISENCALNKCGQINKHQNL